MALSQLLLLKSDLELALGPLSMKYFDTLSVVLNEDEPSATATALQQLQDMVLGSAQLASLHNAFIKQLAASQSETLDTGASQEGPASAEAAAMQPTATSTWNGPVHHMDPLADYNLFQLSSKGLRSHIIASHQAASAPFEEQGVAQTLNLLAAREGLSGVATDVPVIMQTAVETMIKQTLHECLMVKGRHVTHIGHLHYRFRGSLAPITPQWLHTAMVCRPTLFQDLLLTHREAAGIACDDEPRLPDDWINSQSSGSPTIPRPQLQRSVLDETS
eukprot:m.31058 g.31058  ORF g.31058 m.31058 type:complete len:275 (+) comp12027_c0_seq2:102-926(+)